jgi:hypothetical protein
MTGKMIAALCLLFIGLTVSAQEEGLRVDWPPPVYDLSGVVTVTGTVDVPGLRSHYLEAAEYNAADPQSPVSWLPVSLPRRDPVIDGVLGQWDTTIYADGLYQLRLRVLLESGESRFVLVAPLRLLNQTQRPAGEAQVVRPVPTLPPTETPQPTPDLPRPTPTIFPRPQVVNELPLPVGGHVISFSENTVAAMQRAGMTWMKWQIPFIVGEGSLIDVAYDRIDFAHRNGFRVMLSIKGEKDELAELGFEEYFPLYAQFVGQIAALQPDAIQVWNEQNLDREWPQGRIDPRAYVELLRQSYTAIKAVDPSIMVITGAPAPTGAEGAFGPDRVWNDDRYYLGMANAGAANFADCLGVHYNEGIIPPGQQGGDPRQPDYPTRYFPLMIQRAAFPFRQFDIPLCFSELGYLSPQGYGPLPQGFAWAANVTVQQQANWLRDAIRIAAQTPTAEVALIIVWNIDFDVYTQDDPQGGYAIIRPDGTCPACDTIASLRGS